MAGGDEVMPESAVLDSLGPTVPTAVVARQYFTRPRGRACRSRAGQGSAGEAWRATDDGRGCWHVPFRTENTSSA